MSKPIKREARNQLEALKAQLQALRLTLRLALRGANEISDDLDTLDRQMGQRLSAAEEESELPPETFVQ